MGHSSNCRGFHFVLLQDGLINPISERTPLPARCFRLGSAREPRGMPEPEAETLVAPELQIFTPPHFIGGELRFLPRCFFARGLVGVGGGAGRLPRVFCLFLWVVTVWCFFFWGRFVLDTCCWELFFSFSPRVFEFLKLLSERV